LIKRSQVKYKYALSCVFSSIAGLLGVLNPISTILLIDKAKDTSDIIKLLPFIIIFVSAKGLQFWLRVKTATFLQGNQRAPIIWLQHKIGKWLWWMEPMLHNWGFVGMIVTKLSGKAGIAVQIASAVTYTINDLLITVASGVIYYCTESFILSFAVVLILPALFVIPWVAKNALKFKKYDSDFEEYKVIKGNFINKK
jgi:ABC-type bacteriocin/lantibiotic exporter with double-glycine peptidase domain